MSTPPAVVGFRAFPGVGVGRQRRCNVRIAIRESTTSVPPLFLGVLFGQLPRWGSNFVMGGVETLGAAQGGWYNEVCIW